MTNPRSVRPSPVRFIRHAIVASAVLLTLQAQAAPPRHPAHHNQGHHMHEGPRGRPPVVRPPIHPRPPPPVIVVPPCKRGGHGITPC